MDTDKQRERQVEAEYRHVEGEYLYWLRCCRRHFAMHFAVNVQYYYKRMERVAYAQK